jgi:hypothetical protein
MPFTSRESIAAKTKNTKTFIAASDDENEARLVAGHRVMDEAEYLDMPE